MMNRPILLVGTGSMALEYASVLLAMNCSVIAVGRSKENVVKFIEKTGIEAVEGGIDQYLKKTKTLFDYAIVAVGVEELAKTTVSLLDGGVKNILVEKPAGLNVEEIEWVESTAKNKNGNVYVAYNRRFYSSVIEAQRIINEDGGVTSFSFEFTEWGHIIERLNKSKEILKYWFFCNSTHVVDLAFFLGGKPKEMVSYSEGSTLWHPSASVFSGAGITGEGALFSYHANWESAGRWGVELLTRKHRLILRPLEELHIQKKGSIDFDKIQLNNKFEMGYKPGLFGQIECFLSHNKNKPLLTITEHLQNTFIYLKIRDGYTK